MPELSILIPARNEMFLRKTVEDILEHMEADTEIIVVFDGADSLSPVPSHPAITKMYEEKSIGQRAATNKAAKIARGKYLMKVDAHCAFDQGFDRKMLEAFKYTGDNVTMVPSMKNLYVFDWVCPQGHRRYQGPEGPCEKCGKPTTMDVVWKSKPSPNSTSFLFDSEPHFQYFGAYKKRVQKDEHGLTETMSLQGSCFMCTKERYFALNLCDESWGSWGSQGIEVACKTWLSGGRVLCNHNTWYAHMFRTQPGFSFPWGGPRNRIDKQKARELFFDNKWPLQTRPLSWLLEKFWPVPGWTEEQLKTLKAWPLQNGESQVTHKTMGVIYYTDNELNPEIMSMCQKQLTNAFTGEIVSVSLQPLDFGKNITLPLQRGVLTMCKQILAGLEASTADYVFFCEHDVLYHKSHFDFIPPRDDVYYYNMNSWIVRMTDGFSVYYDHKSLSGLCANRQLLIKHYKERIRRIEKEGFSRRMGFEPGTHGRAERVDNFKAEGWRSELPNVDLKHGKNLTQARWRPQDFRSQRSCRNWKESYEVPGWGKIDSNAISSNIIERR